ncbi:MAG: hypothetical protein WCS17_12165, partial [Prevotella sp.]
QSDAQMRTDEQDQVEQRPEQEGLVSGCDERAVETQGIEDGRQMDPQRSVEETEIAFTGSGGGCTNDRGSQNPCYQTLSELRLK